MYIPEQVAGAWGSLAGAGRFFFTLLNYNLPNLSRTKLLVLGRRGNLWWQHSVGFPKRGEGVNFHLKVGGTKSSGNTGHPIATILGV